MVVVGSSIRRTGDGMYRRSRLRGATGVYAKATVPVLHPHVSLSMTEA